jgi:hypothetical protein
MNNPYLNVLNQVLQVLDGQPTEVCIWFMHQHSVRSPLCADILSQLIDWLRYTEREIFRHSNDYDEQFRKPKNREGNETKKTEKKINIVIIVIEENF